MKDLNSSYNKTKSLKLFFPVLIYSLAFLINDHLIIPLNQYQDVSKYFRNYYCGLICLYIVIISLSYYLNDILSWIYIGILGFTLNILFLFSDNVNINQFAIENSDLLLKQVLWVKWWANIVLMAYLILMVIVLVHSHKKLIMSSLTEDLYSNTGKEE